MTPSARRGPAPRAPVRPPPPIGRAAPGPAGAATADWLAGNPYQCLSRGVRWIEAVGERRWASAARRGGPASAAVREARRGGREGEREREAERGSNCWIFTEFSTYLRAADEMDLVYRGSPFAPRAAWLRLATVCLQGATHQWGREEYLFFLILHLKASLPYVAELTVYFGSGLK